MPALSGQTGFPVINSLRTFGLKLKSKTAMPVSGVFHSRMKAPLNQIAAYSLYTDGHGHGCERPPSNLHAITPRLILTYGLQIGVGVSRLGTSERSDLLLSLTQKIVREKYTAHLGVEKIADEERSKLKQIVSKLVEEYIQATTTQESEEVEDDLEKDRESDLSEGQSSEDEEVDLLPEEAEIKSDDCGNAKRKFVSSQSENGYDSDSKARRQPKKKIKIDCTDPTNSKSRSPKKGSPNKGNKKMPIEQTNTRGTSPRKKSSNKSQKRVSVEDVRESVLNKSGPDSDESAENSSSEDESNCNEEEVIELAGSSSSEKEDVEWVGVAKKLKKTAVVDSESEYGSPFKDESMSRRFVGKPRKKRGVFSLSSSDSDADVEVVAEQRSFTKKKQVKRTPDKKNHRKRGPFSTSSNSSGTDEESDFTKTPDVTPVKTPIKMYSGRNSKSPIKRKEAKSGQEKVKHHENTQKDRKTEKAVSSASESDGLEDEASSKKKARQWKQKLKKQLVQSDSDAAKTSATRESGSVKGQRETGSSKGQKEAGSSKRKADRKNSMKTKETGKDTDTSDRSINEDSDTENVKPSKKTVAKRPEPAGPSSEESHCSDSEEWTRHQKSKKKTEGNDTSPTETKGKKTKGENMDPKKTAQVVLLEKMARHCGLMPCGRNYSKVFGDCDTAAKRVAALRRILADAGMEGKPTWKGIEKLKLERETAELDTGNILTEGGRGRRNVQSVYSSHTPKPKSPKVVLTPLKETFSRLKGIVDSDDSED